MVDITIIIDKLKAAVEACEFPEGFFLPGESLHFDHGHITEISGKLLSKNKNLLKYPLVILVEDFPQEVFAGMIHVELRLFIVVVNPDTKMYAPQRYEVTVEPKLKVIYNELMKRISTKGFSWDKRNYPGVFPPHTVTVRTNFGVWLRELKGTIKNLMNDPLDALEIENLKLNSKSC